MTHVESRVVVLQVVEERIAMSIRIGSGHVSLFDLEITCHNGGDTITVKMSDKVVVGR